MRINKLKAFLEKHPNKLTDATAKAVTLVQDNWKTPRPGEYTTLKEFLFYWQQLFPNQEKTIKKLRKANRLAEYKSLADSLIVSSAHIADD